MAFHFSRWGLLIPLTFILSCAAVVIGIDLTIGHESVKGYRWPNCLIFFLSGTTCWLLRNKFKTIDKEITIDSRRRWKWTYERTNTFFFISFKAWAFVFYGFMLYHLFKPVTWGT